MVDAPSPVLGLLAFPDRIHHYLRDAYGGLRRLSDLLREQRISVYRVIVVDHE